MNELGFYVPSTVFQPFETIKEKLVKISFVSNVSQDKSTTFFESNVCL